MTTEAALTPGDADVVVPVFGGLRHVRACLDELRRWTRDVDHRLIVVDDASDSHTHEALTRLVAEGWGERGRVLTNEHNQGFLRTANRGMRAGSSPVVALLNSDTLPTPAWLSGLMACLHSADDVGIVCPTSNYSNVTRIDVPYGVDHLRMAAAVRRVSPRDYPDLGLVSGFCLVARRSLLNEMDYFDEVYGRGYFEDADLCLRARAAGWRVLADDATYVHHHGWGSFGPEEHGELVAVNRERFQQRWEDANREIVQRVRERRPFAELERRTWLALKDRAQVHPRRDLPSHRSRRAAERARQGRLEPVQHRPPPASAAHALEQWPALLRSRPAVPHEAGDVIVLVDDLLVTPFTTDVLHLVDRLARFELDVALATTGSYDAALYSDPCRVRPYVLESHDEAATTLPAHRLVVATSPATVFDAVLLAARDGSRIAAWFEPQAEPVRLGWPDEGWASVLAPSLSDAHVGPALPRPPSSDVAEHVAPIGVDLDLFRPPTAGGHRRAGVVIPYTTASGAAVAADTAAAVSRLRSEGVEVTLYGDDLPTAHVAGVVPFSPQSHERDLLTAHGVLVEIGPVPGLERLRLRCAATGTPLVLSGPTGRTCPLEPGAQAAVAPRGDVARSVELALTALTAPSAQQRAEAALERARRRGIDREARALLAVYDALVPVTARSSPTADGPSQGDV